MSTSILLEKIAPNVWRKSFPLKMLGVDLQRVVTILRLNSGKLIIHSTAPFSKFDEKEIRALGEPVWLLDVLLRHDTFSAEGKNAFPETTYLTPPGFEAPEGIVTESIIPEPVEWADEISALLVEGAPAFSEIVLLHRPSRTLIVGDLLFNFPGKQDLWTKFFLKIGAVGGNAAPGMTRPFHNAIKDEAAFAESVRRILDWDFDRIIVGHGEPVQSGAKEKMRVVFESAGVLRSKKNYFTFQKGLHPARSNSSFAVPSGMER